MSGMSKARAPLKDDVGSSTIWELAGRVANSLRILELQDETEVPYNTALELLSSRPADFFLITEHANERLRRHEGTNATKSSVSRIRGTLLQLKEFA